MFGPNKTLEAPKLTLSDRLFELVAEDNAIEDTIYHLHRALNAGRIDLEKFLRVSASLRIDFPRQVVWLRMNSLRFFRQPVPSPRNNL